MVEFFLVKLDNGAVMCFETVNGKPSRFRSDRNGKRLFCELTPLILFVNVVGANGLKRREVPSFLYGGWEDLPRIFIRKRGYFAQGIEMMMQEAPDRKWVILELHLEEGATIAFPAGE